MRRINLIALILSAYLLWPSHPVSAQANITLTDNVDVSGADAVVTAASSGVALYVDAINPSATATIRCGSASTVSATVGKPIAAGGAFHWQAIPIDPSQSFSQHRYALSSIGCYVPSGGKVNFSWAN